MSPTKIRVVSVPWAPERDLITVLPHGVAVVTHPDPHRRWSVSAQCAQADEHRDLVRARLAEAGLRRLDEGRRP